MIKTSVCNYDNCTKTTIFQQSSALISCPKCGGGSYCSQSCLQSDNDHNCNSNQLNLTNTQINNSMNDTLRSVQSKSRTLEDYEFYQGDKGLLGRGAYGEVKLAKDTQLHHDVAIKIINKKKMFRHCNVLQLKNEIKLQRSLNHPHIIQLYHAFEDRENIYFSLEFAPNGSLYKYLRKQKKLQEREAFVYFFQTCIAVDYLHKKGIIHRDLKPENILLDEQGNIKICDFGWSAEQIEMRSTFCGTLEYMAPEMLNNKPHDFKVDIWALGIFLYELIHGKSPVFQKDKKGSVQQQLIDFDQTASPQIKDLIKNILQVDPNKRLSMPLIFKHNWMVQQSVTFDMEIDDYIYHPSIKTNNNLSVLSQLDEQKVQNTSLSKINESRTVQQKLSYKNDTIMEDSMENSIRNTSKINEKFNQEFQTQKQSLTNAFSPSLNNLKVSVQNQHDSQSPVKQNQSSEQINNSPYFSKHEIIQEDDEDSKKFSFGSLTNSKNDNHIDKQDLINQILQEQNQKNNQDQNDDGKVVAQFSRGDDWNQFLKNNQTSLQNNSEQNLQNKIQIQQIKEIDLSNSRIVKETEQALKSTLEQQQQQQNQFQQQKQQYEQHQIQKQQQQQQQQQKQQNISQQNQSQSLSQQQLNNQNQKIEQKKQSQKQNSNQLTNIQSKQDTSESNSENELEYISAQLKQFNNQQKMKVNKFKHSQKEQLAINQSFQTEADDQQKQKLKKEKQNKSQNKRESKSSSKSIVQISQKSKQQIIKKHKNSKDADYRNFNLKDLQYDERVRLQETQDSTLKLQRKARQLQEMIDYSDESYNKPRRSRQQIEHKTQKSASEGLGIFGKIKLAFGCMGDR